MHGLPGCTISTVEPAQAEFLEPMHLIGQSHELADLSALTGLKLNERQEQIHRRDSTQGTGHTGCCTTIIDFLLRQIPNSSFV